MSLQDSPAYQNNKPQKRKTPKPPRKITASYLRNSGLFYLQRFTASSGHFKTVMMRKIRKSCRHHTEQNMEECETMLDGVIETLIKERVLDDAGYLRGMVNSLRRQGKSSRVITTKLQQKQIPASDIEAALKSYDIENFEDPYEAEFLSALKIARKKRVGVFDIRGKYEFDKAIAVMARQGFSYQISKRVLNIGEADIEDLPYEYQNDIYQALESKLALEESEEPSA